MSLKPLREEVLSRTMAEFPASNFKWAGDIATGDLGSSVSMLVCEKESAETGPYVEISAKGERWFMVLRPIRPDSPDWDGLDKWLGRVKKRLDKVQE